MKYCTKCGKQIHDEAVICVHCGCATESTQRKNINVEEDNRFKSLINDINAIFVLGILSIALCLGIGLVFQIINMCKLSKYNNKVQKGYTLPEFRLTNPNDIQAYENAKKKIKTASTLTGVGFGISASLIFLAIWFGLVMPAIL